MFCPNCGLQNPDNAKFCANCGTTLVAGSQPANQPQYQASQPAQSYQASPLPGTGNSVAKNIAIGCLIAVVVVMVFGLSCTRACYRLTLRRHYFYRPVVYHVPRRGLIRQLLALNHADSRTSVLSQ
jgi:hypothetical protein